MVETIETKMCSEANLKKEEEQKTCKTHDLIQKIAEKLENKIPKYVDYALNQLPVRGLLSAEEIRKRVYIAPLAEESRSDEISYGFSSYGYDFRLGYKFAFLKYNSPLGYIDPKAAYKSDSYYETYIHSPFLLKPKSFVLAESIEYFKIPRDIIGICVGKSTYARNGVNVFITPLEPEWFGRLTVEIFNANDFPVMLYPGEGIAQILFFSAEKECFVSYKDRKNRHYQDQEGLKFSEIK